MMTFCLRTLAVLAAMLSMPVTASAQGRWGEGYMPNLPVVDQHGRTYKFYDDLIKKKLVVISFIYTSCRDICPLVTARLALVQDALGDVVGRDIQFYSITVDPEHDKPEHMRQHAEAFRAGPGWLFLTGLPADIHAIRHKLGDRSRNLNEHRNEILLGNGTTNEWSRDSLFGDLDRLAMTIRGLDPKWREKERIPPPEHADVATRPLDGPPGQALFIRACAACHTIGSGDRVGPDLAGVTSRRDRTWLMSFIVAPDKLRSERDPIALELVKKYERVRMPNLGLAPADATDLVAYLDAITYAASAPPPPNLSHHHDDHAQHGHDTSPPAKAKGKAKAGTRKTDEAGAHKH